MRADPGRASPGDPGHVGRRAGPRPPRGQPVQPRAPDL